MITPVIHFDIHDFKNANSETYVVPNSPEMVDQVLRHRFTRNISFQNDFSIEPINFRFPVAFINFTAEDEIDPIDQMH